MRLILRPLLPFLRELVSFLRKRWGQTTRRLWYILVLLRSYFSSKCPKKRDDIRRTIECRPAKPNPTAVICASQLPRHLTSLSDNGTPSIEVRQPSVDDNRHGYHTDSRTDHLDANNLLPGRSEPISGPSDTITYHDEPDTIGAPLAPNREDSTRPNSPKPFSRIDSRSSSRLSNHPTSQHVGYQPPYHGEPQYPRWPPSEHPYRSPPDLDGAELAARGYLPAPPTSAQFVRPRSPAGSDSSHVYRASRPTTPVRRPYPMTNSPRRGNRSVTPVSPRRSAYEAPPDVSGLGRSKSQVAAPVSQDYSNTGISSHPMSAPPEGRLRPIIGIDRYEEHKKVKVEETINQEVFPPVTTQFVRDSVPENWVPLVHPEGALYWRNRNAPIYTDANMCDPNLYRRIEEALAEIDKLKENVPDLPLDDWELALQLGDDETDGPICSYYYVRHSTRCLFWLHNFNPESAMVDLCGVTERTHIHLALQVQYWYHWEMYPHNRRVPKSLVQELLGILVHAGVDCMTSQDSTAPYSEGELSKLIGYVNHVTSIGGNYGFSACVVGRLMNFFLYARYLNFYGQEAARLTNDQTIYGAQPTRTYLIKILSFLFFYTPELYLKGLESVYTDFVICQHRWVRFITQPQDEWGGIIINGTVLLNANVAFLAIPSVDVGDHARTPAQLASYFSTVMSIGSVVIGLLLVRKHRNKPHDSADEVDGYLRSRHNRALGFEAVAILYSLPYSLLMWSTVAFTSAFGLETLVYSRPTWTKLLVGIIFLMVLLLIFWCVLTTVEAEANFSILRGLHRAVKDHFVGLTRGLRGNPSRNRPVIEDGRYGDGHRSETSRTFSFIRRRRRKRGSTLSTLINENPIGSSASGFLSDNTGMELNEINKGKVQESAV